jgi:hypothetical protein
VKVLSTPAEAVAAEVIADDQKRFLKNSEAVSNI